MNDVWETAPHWAFFLSLVWRERLSQVRPIGDTIFRTPRSLYGTLGTAFFSCVLLGGCVMRTVYGGSLAGARKIDGQISQRADALDRIAQTPAPQRVTHINGQRIRFRDLAKFAWPDKTEFFLADLTGVDPRTCRRWLADDNEPPADALGVVLCEIMRRFHQRD